MRGGGDPRSRETRINERIRAREVRVIDDEGQMLGVMTSLAALNLAREQGLDLVEVQPMAVPPVCKILDWGRFKYEQSKKENEARKHQKVTQLREIRMKPRTGEHDVDVRVRKIFEFLAEGDKVKISVTFRGRELAHTELGRVLLERVTQALKGAALIERTPLMEGKMMSMIVARAPGWEPQKEAKKAAASAEVSARVATTAEGAAPASNPVTEPEPATPRVEAPVPAPAPVRAATPRPPAPEPVNAAAPVPPAAAPDSAARAPVEIAAPEPAAITPVEVAAAEPPAAAPVETGVTEPPAAPAHPATTR
ncbi:MAG TPA: translation initiation factor IF-3, partial [Ktedonobacterales bacterium]